jgi:hypothetical protein
MNYSGFHPELFAHRALAMERLQEKHLVWLGDFTAIDLLHEDFGLEVCGIKREEDAKRILKILSELFADWAYGQVSFRDKIRDRGWKVEIFKRKRTVGQRGAARVDPASAKRRGLKAALRAALKDFTPGKKKNKD